MAEAVARIRTTPAGHYKPAPGRTLVPAIMPPDLLQRLDDFRYGYRLPSRGAAIRFLLEAALDQDPIPEPQAREVTQTE